MSLEDCPKSVASDFSCSANKLTDLKYCPISVYGVFDCRNNQITTLDFCPVLVGGKFLCYGNPLIESYQEITDFVKLKEILASDRERLILSASIDSPVKSSLHKL